MCHQCKGSGWVVSTSKKNGSLYASKCNCEAGNNLGNSVPKWNSKLKAHYHPDYEMPEDKRPIPEPKKPEFSADDLPEEAPF